MACNEVGKACVPFPPAFKITKSPLMGTVRHFEHRPHRIALHQPAETSYDGGKVQPFPEGSSCELPSEAIIAECFLRAKLVDFLQSLGQEVLDMGAYDETEVDYPDIASAVAQKVAGHEVDRGILVCGMGVGMCIVANKFPGVRAAPATTTSPPNLARRHNDLNVLCLSGDLIGEKLADRLVEIWLRTPFEGGRHERRKQKIAQLESTR